MMIVVSTIDMLRPEVCNKQKCKVGCWCEKLKREVSNSTHQQVL